MILRSRGKQVCSLLRNLRPIAFNCLCVFVPPAPSAIQDSCSQVTGLVLNMHWTSCSHEQSGAWWQNPWWMRFCRWPGGWWKRKTWRTCCHIAEFDSCSTMLWLSTLGSWETCPASDATFWWPQSLLQAWPEPQSVCSFFAVCNCRFELQSISIQQLQGTIRLASGDRLSAHQSFRGCLERTWPQLWKTAAQDQADIALNSSQLVTFAHIFIHFHAFSHIFICTFPPFTCQGASQEHCCTRSVVTWAWKLSEPLASNVQAWKHEKVVKCHQCHCQYLWKFVEPSVVPRCPLGWLWLIHWGPGATRASHPTYSNQSVFLKKLL